MIYFNNFKAEEVKDESSTLHGHIEFPYPESNILISIGDKVAISSDGSYGRQSKGYYTITNLKSGNHEIIFTDLANNKIIPSTYTAIYTDLASNKKISKTEKFNGSIKIFPGDISLDFFLDYSESENEISRISKKNQNDTLIEGRVEFSYRQDGQISDSGYWPYASIYHTSSGKEIAKADRYGYFRVKEKDIPLELYTEAEANNHLIKLHARGLADDQQYYNSETVNTIFYKKINEYTGQWGIDEKWPFQVNLIIDKKPERGFRYLSGNVKTSDDKIVNTAKIYYEYLTTNQVNEQMVEKNHGNYTIPIYERFPSIKIWAEDTIYGNSSKYTVTYNYQDQNRDIILNQNNKSISSPSMSYEHNTDLNIPLNSDTTTEPTPTSTMPSTPNASTEPISTITPPATPQTISQIEKGDITNKSGTKEEAIKKYITDKNITLLDKNSTKVKEIATYYEKSESKTFLQLSLGEKSDSKALADSIKNGSVAVGYDQENEEIVLVGEGKRKLLIFKTYWVRTDKLIYSDIDI